MHRDAALHAHADRGDLVFGEQPAHPDAAAPLDPVSLDAEAGEHLDEDAFESPHVRDDIDGLDEAHDRVADDLAGAVPGDLAAAVDVDDGGAVGGSFVAGGAGAGGEHRFVLEQQQRVGSRARGDLAVDPALERPAVGVGDQVGSEPHCLHVEHDAPSDR